MSQIKLREQVQWREVEGQIVALDTDAAKYFAVNETGAAIWPLLVEGAALPELVERLVATYGIDRSAAGGDVEAFLNGLEQRGLLADR
jgi:Coenzyme PQQ synthesis protein D (PqqD)